MTSLSDILDGLVSESVAQAADPTVVELFSRAADTDSVKRKAGRPKKVEQIEQVISRESGPVSLENTPSAAAPQVIVPLADSSQGQSGPVSSDGLASTSEPPSDQPKYNYDLDITIEGLGDGVSTAPANSIITGLEGLGDAGGLDSKLDWVTYQQKIKEVFIKSRSFREIYMFASNMNFKDWLEFVLKLLPKDIKVQGEINFKHFLEEFGPVDKSKYLPTNVTEVEFSEV